MALRVGQSKYEEGIIGDFQARNITARAKIEFLGDWDRVTVIFNKLPQDIQNSAYKAIYEYTLLYYRNVQKAIKQNGPPNMAWRPYSLMYANKKRATGRYGYPAFYRLKGKLHKAIIIEADGKKVVRVNVNKNIMVGNGGDSFMSASQLMNILEHGSVSRNINARPLFGPVWKAMGGNKGLSTYVGKKLSKKLKSYNNGIANF